MGKGMQGRKEGKNGQEEGKPLTTHQCSSFCYFLSLFIDLAFKLFSAKIKECFEINISTHSCMRDFHKYNNLRNIMKEQLKQEIRTSTSNKQKNIYETHS